MRVVAADDLALRAAQRTHQPEMLGGIDLERVVVARNVPTGVQGSDIETCAIAPSLDQPAAFPRKGRPLLPLELRTVISAEPHDHFGGFSSDASGTLIRPTRRPSCVSMMSTSSPS